jgi:hypothetical protein
MITAPSGGNAPRAPLVKLETLKPCEIVDEVLRKHNSTGLQFIYLVIKEAVPSLYRYGVAVSRTGKVKAPLKKRKQLRVVRSKREATANGSQTCVLRPF